MKGWGADGCRGGWVFCSFSPQAGPEFHLVKSMSDFFDKKEFSELLFVDTPIGLSSNSWRKCDLDLKKALGAKRSSVFLAPVRDAVWAKDYREACSINQAATGKKISIQSWNICPPIREVEELLRERGELRRCVRESHPEFLFQLLNGEPLKFEKKEREGAEERIRILKSVGLDSESKVWEFYNSTKRKDVQLDDIIDSLVLAISAYLSSKSEVLSIPNSPELDDFSLEMGIWYPKENVYT